MSRIALLIAGNLASDAPDRRADAHLFDIERRALEAGLAGQGLHLSTLRWMEEGIDWSWFDAALVLAVWDYQDRPQDFLSRIDLIQRAGCAVFNPPELVRWNIRKTYLKDFEAKGVAIVPTLWSETPDAAAVRAAFDTFGTDSVVLKRQVGAGARGQQKFSRASAPASGVLLDRAGMIQPFIASVASEGEYSFLFVDGVFSHALVKRAARGDYRIQESYGGTSAKVEPAAADITQARAVLEALAVPPLYARVDMVRGEDGRLMVMELEVIEPYLFPVEGPRIGEMIGVALKKRLG
jgi:hypothetical protein